MQVAMGFFQNLSGLGAMSQPLSFNQSPAGFGQAPCCREQVSFGPQCQGGNANIGQLLGNLLGSFGAGDPQQMTQMLMGMLMGMMTSFAQSPQSGMGQGFGGQQFSAQPFGGRAFGGGQFGGGCPSAFQGGGFQGGPSSGASNFGPVGGNFNIPAQQGQQVWDGGMRSGQGFSFRAGMAIDTDGVGSSHGDRWHQNETSMRLAGGGYLNADTTPYMVLPPQLAKQYGVKPGDLALVKYRGRVSPAVFGDVGPRNKLGEGSTRLAANLGINTDPNRGGTDGGVEYQVFPGSGRGVRWTHENTTTAALWDRINQG
jgi:hypothetical protein